MKNHGLRRVFSLLLALFMVFTLLPTAALAEENTDLTDTQVVETEGEKKADPPAPQSQEAPEQKPATVTYTVTYTDGVDDEEIFKDQATENLKTGDKTPAFNGTPTRDGYQFKGWSPTVTDTVTGNVTYTAQWEMLETVQLVIYRNGDTSKAYKTVSLESQPKGHVIDLTTLDIGDYYTGKYDFSGWYDDGTWNTYKENLANPPAGLSEIKVNGWTKIIGMVYDYEKVVYFRSAEDLAAYQNDHSKTDGLLYSTTARHGSTLPTATPPTPTREGYRFLYWSREGQSSDVTGQTVNGWTNLYAVWEKENTYTVTYTDGRGGMWFTNEVHSGLKTGDPTPKYNNGVNPIREGYNFTGWLPEVAETVTENAKYEAQWESKSEMLIKELLGKIKVECVSDSSHTAKEYDTSVGGFSAVTNGDRYGNFTSTITVEAAKYVAKYNEDTNVTHRLTGGEAEKQTIVVKFDSTYNKDSVTVKSGTLPVVFKVKCKDEVVPPTEPTLDELRELLGKVTVDCTNANASHPDEKYDLIEDSYIASIQEQTDAYVCMVSVYANKYVDKYNETYPGHSLAGSENIDKVKLVYLSATKTDTGYTPWNVSNAEPLTFTVTCNTEITPPTEPTFEQLPEISVTLHCGTTTEHHDPTWLLLENSYEVGKVELKNGVYTCILTVKAEKYVDEYSTATYGVGKHELDDTATKTITLTWKDGKWTAETSSVTFKVKCTLYTVTYTDGVKNKVIFKNQVYADLAYGENTPKFSGTPKRSGYTFTGWSPKVTDTVTGTVTYKAQWKSNSGKDNVPKTGDGEIVMTLSSVLLFSFCGAAAVCVFDRKRKHF